MTDADVSKTLEDFAASVAEAPDRDGAFKAAEAATQALIGHRLFTVMMFDAPAMEVQRCYSSDPASYPVGGRKRKRDTPWGAHILEQGKPFIGRGPADIEWAFDDSALILSLGLISVLNVPIKRGGRVVGTMNMLDATDHYTDADAEIAMEIAARLADAVSDV